MGVFYAQGEKRVTGRNFIHDGVFIIKTIEKQADVIVKESVKKLSFCDYGKRMWFFIYYAN